MLAPLAAKAGIALIDTKGYVVEYAKTLSQYSKQNGGHISMITDFDSDGLLMSLDVHDTVSKDIYRIGIDFDTIDELKRMYPELKEKLMLDKLQESYTPGTSIKRLNRLAFYGSEKKLYQHNLDYIKHKRIEIDSVQRAVGYKKLWAFIIKKLVEKFPERDYNRGIKIPDVAYPDIFIQLHELLNDRIRPELDPLIQAMKASLRDFKGVVDDVNDDENSMQEYFNKEMNLSNNLIPYLSAMWILVEQFKQLKDENK